MQSIWLYGMKVESSIYSIALYFIRSSSGILNASIAIYFWLPADEKKFYFGSKDSGFEEKKVADMCKKKTRQFDLVKKWYDGYTVGDKRSMYNPYSIMCVMESGKYASYWKKTSAAEAGTSLSDKNSIYYLRGSVHESGRNACRTWHSGCCVHTQKTI